MRTIRVLKNDQRTRSKEDVNFIQDSLMNKGFYASSEQCVELWELYSEWIGVDWCLIEGLTKEGVYARVRDFFEPGPEGSVDTRYL